jgi:hypothetical protein
VARLLELVRVRRLSLWFVLASGSYARLKEALSPQDQDWLSAAMADQVNAFVAHVMAAKQAPLLQTFKQALQEEGL